MSIPSDKRIKDIEEFKIRSNDCFYRNGSYCKHKVSIAWDCHVLCYFRNCPRANCQKHVPDNIDMHAAGAKDDGKKVKAGVLGDFGLALMEVAKIGTGGLEKYSRGGWQEVANGMERYNDAAWRHILKKRYVSIDEDFGLPHMAHLAWNILAELELMLRDSIEKAVEEGANRDEAIEELMADMGTVYENK